MTLNEILKASYSHRIKDKIHFIELNCGFNPNKSLPRGGVKIMKCYKCYKSVDGKTWIEISKSEFREI